MSGDLRRFKASRLPYHLQAFARAEHKACWHHLLGTENLVWALRKLSLFFFSKKTTSTSRTVQTGTLESLASKILHFSARNGGDPSRPLISS